MDDKHLIVCCPLFIVFLVNLFIVRKNRVPAGEVDSWGKELGKCTHQWTMNISSFVVHCLSWRSNKKKIKKRIKIGQTTWSAQAKTSFVLSMLLCANSSFSVYENWVKWKRRCQFKMCNNNQLCCCSDLRSLLIWWLDTYFCLSVYAIMLKVIILHACELSYFCFCSYLFVQWIFLAFVLWIFLMNCCSTSLE